MYKGGPQFDSITYLSQELATPFCIEKFNLGFGKVHVHAIVGGGKVHVSYPGTLWMSILEWT
jgi:hypothetical protein